MWHAVIVLMAGPSTNVECMGRSPCCLDGSLIRLFVINTRLDHEQPVSSRVSI